MKAKLCGVVHKAVFEIAGSIDEEQAIRLPFHDPDEAEQMAPAIERLVNSVEANARCGDVLKALSLYLDNGDGSQTGRRLISKAAAMLNCIEMLRIETRQSVD